MVAEVPPPADLSGGYVILKYTDGTDIHKQRIHLSAWNATTFAYDAALTGGGAEADIGVTVAAYLQFVKKFYHSAWTWSLDSVFRRTGTNTFTQQFGYPTVTPVAGTAVAAVSGLARAVEQIFNMRTALGRRVRFVYVAGSNAPNAVPVIYSANAAGNDSEKMIAYVQNGAHGIRAHDGSLPIGPAKITTPYNSRLRRHYGYA